MSSFLLLENSSHLLVEDGGSLVLEDHVFDTTPPTPTILSGPTLSKISAQATKNSSDITWESNEDFTSYMLRVVPSTSSLYTEGTLIEADQNPSGGGTAGTDYTSTITEAELTAASPGDAAKIVKLFTRDAAGNWST